MKRLSIPIVLGPPRQGAPNDFSARPPLAFVHLSIDVNDPWNNHSQKGYCALIDTGADATAIDSIAASAIGAQPIGTANIHGWKGAETRVDLVRVSVVFPVGAIFTTTASIRDFRGDGQPFDLILGRNFLRNCVLTSDGPNAQYQLEWVGADR